jgi:single-strand DNA-binding protein
MHLNVFVGAGNLGADPDLKYTSSGKAVCNMRIATNRKFVDSKGEKQERTDWHRIVVFGQQAEACAKYLKKGRLIAVQGEMHSRSYQKKIKVGDAETEETVYVVECIAKTVHFGPRPGQGTAVGGEENNVPSDYEESAGGTGIEPSLGEPDVL